ncbi:MAG TPA: SynChlorMet cassette radical SAM/SPASM protein ScmF [Desulfobulbaceae bacterium]|nr:SynChlorMet cassette radical SAM/SPASM protein ScmF [Desulfobulbaceae bacterium]
MNSGRSATGPGATAGAPPLDQLYFYLSEGCNLACVHCWLSPRHDPAARAAFLPLELLRSIIAEAKPLGLTGVKLTGGEPLLHPDIHAILDLVHAEQLALTMETNATLCTPEIAANIARQCNPFVSVSLDATHPETHDRLRGVAGAFERTIQAIRTLVAHQIPTQIIMSLLRDNVGQLEKMIELAADLGVESLKFNLVQPIGRGMSLHAADRSLSVAEILDLARKVETEIAPHAPVRLYFDCPPAFKPLKRIASGRDGCSVCGIFSILGVLATGQYSLCGIGTLVPELIFGQAGKDPLANVWCNTRILHEIRQGLPGDLTGVCGRCLMKHICLGSCLAQNRYRTGSIWSPFWLCAEAEKRGLFPVSRLDCTLSS